MKNLAGVLSTVSIILFALAAAALIVAVVLFIYFRIPKVYGDLSGKTAKKSIKQMREGNEKKQAKGHQPSSVNKQRGELTQTAGSLGAQNQSAAAKASAPKAGTAASKGSVQASKTQNAAPQAKAAAAAPKAKPKAKTDHELSNQIYYEDSDAAQTGIMGSNKAQNVSEGVNETSLLIDEEETTLLNGSEETTLLSENGGGRVIAPEKGGIALRIIEEVMLIHTDEVI